jgi:ParB family chromosome partitioning protein
MVPLPARAAPPEAGKLVCVPVAQVAFNPWRGRAGDDPEGIRELAADIAANGLIHYPVARRVGGDYQLQAGHRRLLAWPLAFPDQPIPLIVREIPDRDMAIASIVEQEKRLGLTLVEKARLAQMLIEVFGMSQAEVAPLFDWKSQSTVSHALSVLKLPERVQDLVHQGHVPERLARPLVKVAAVAPDQAEAVAEKVAKAKPEDKEDVAERALVQVYRKAFVSLRGGNFSLDWEPGAAVDIEGQAETPPACTGCEQCLAEDGLSYCARRACFEAKKRLWQEVELARLEKKLGIPRAQPEDKVYLLDISYKNRSRMEGWLKRKANRPDVLRLMPDDGSHRDVWDHHTLLKSEGVLIGSTVKGILDKPAAEVKKEKAESETPTERQARVQVEERERDERRAERADLRKICHDMAWLVRNVANSCAHQIMVQPLGLLMDLDEAHDSTRHGPATPWPEWTELFQGLDAQVELKDKPFYELVVRRMIVRELGHRMSEYKPEDQFNWGAALGSVRDWAKTWGMELPADWDKPPVHHTASNCWTCGRFSSQKQLTKGELASGWVAEIEGGVSCSDECRDKLEQSAKGAGRKTQAKRGKK